MTNRLMTLAATAAIIFAGATVAVAKTAEVGKPAPDFTLTDHAGNQVSLSDFEGKIVVLEWTNPDCPFVQRHYKKGTMVNLAKEHEGEEFVWLSVNSTHYWNQEKDANWAEAQELPFVVLNDASGDVGHLYGAKTTPHMFVVDTEGKLVYDGAIDDNARGEAKINYVQAAVNALKSGEAVEMSQTKPYGCSVKYATKSKEKSIG